MKLKKKLGKKKKISFKEIVSSASLVMLSDYVSLIQS